MSAVTTNKRAGWATKIGDAYRKGVIGILETGAYLAQAKNELGNADFWKMVEADLPFKKRMAQYFLAIGPDRRLVQYVAHLPPSASTIFELHRLETSVFERAIREGKINPDMERKDVEVLRLTFGEGKRKPTPKPEPKEAEWTETPAEPSRAPLQSRKAPEVSRPATRRSFWARFMEMPPRNVVTSAAPEERPQIREEIEAARAWLADLERALDQADGGEA